jgi:nicotinamide-nucleotide amidase
MDEEQQQQDLAERIGAVAREQGLTIGVAESLTGGLVSSRIAAAKKASRWYRGAVVAYASEVKYDLLGVPEGPVVSEPAARAMSAGAAKLLEADVAIALTGVGGPEPQDGQPPGTVFLSIYRGGDERAHERHIEGGDPTEICANACTEALRMLAEYLEDAPES